MKLARIAFLVVSLCQLLESDAFVPVKDPILSPTVCHLLPHERIVSRGSIPSRSKDSKDSQVEDDGYSTTKNPLLSLLSKMNPRKTEPGTLILVRHGQTTMNYNKTFTGWIDTDLSEVGKREVEHCGRLLIERGYNVDVTYTSRLKRAIRSSWIILRELGQIYRPVYKSYRLNERMYGALEGKSKVQTCVDMGEDRVASFRTGLWARPPPMSLNDPNWHGTEAKYRDLDPSCIPVSESLQDTMERTLPLLTQKILPDIKKGKTVLVVAHANSLRGVVKYIDSLSEDEIKRVGIPNGIPLVFKFKMEGGKLTPIPQLMAEAPLTGEFLEKKGRLRKLLAIEAELAKGVPGFVPPPVKAPVPVPVSAMATAVAESKRHPLGTSSTFTLPVMSSTPTTHATGPATATANVDAHADPVTASTITASPKALPTIGSSVTLPRAAVKEGADPVVVIIRHGKTEYNKLGIFTGWQDVSLVSEGRAEAAAAGKLLKRHGYTFDVVYTSWLSRAIETAWLVLDELDLLWLPIIKTWRLNERMYGALTGLSKQMVAQRHGPETLKKWRRGYATRPPPISSFSASYPGNDDRYVSNVQDVRYSLFESLIRSLGSRRLELHRKFPKAESLKDCMERTIPYYANCIVPDSIAQGKSVLIASSENAIRGLLMHLCEIPVERIHEVEIPTGLPLVFNVRKKCIQVLEGEDWDDSSLESLDPLSRYNFGTSPELLFRPCKVSDAEDDDGEGQGDEEDSDQCYVGAEGRFYAYDPVIRLIPLEGESTRPTSRNPGPPIAVEGAGGMGVGEMKKEGGRMLEDVKDDLVMQSASPKTAQGLANDVVKDVVKEVVKEVEAEVEAQRMKLTYII